MARLETAPQEDELGIRGSTVRGIGVIAVAVAAVPVIRMLQVIVDGSRIQYADYWPIFDESVRSDGWLSLGHILALRNEHPVASARVLYWLNARLTHGSNIALGFIVVGLILAKLGILGGMLRRTAALSTVTRWVLLPIISFLLFAPEGVHHVGKAMSGSAWIPAEVFALAAMWLYCRDLKAAAMVTAALASVSYGTGLMVWPALLAVGWARSRRWQPDWWVAAGTGVTATWYLLSLPPGATSTPGTNVVDVARLTARNVGALVTLSSGGEVLGWFVLAIGATASVAAIARYGSDAVPWFGVFVFGTAASAFIAFGRTDILESFGPRSRYASLSALVTIGAVVCSVLALPRPQPGLVLGGAAAIAVAFGGQQALDNVEEGPLRQDVLSIMLQLDLAENSYFYSALEPFPTVAEKLRDLDHIPLDGSFDLDCGLLGERLPGDPHPRSGAGGAPGRVKSVQADPLLPGGVVLTGSLQPTDADIRCMVITDEDRSVIGAGAIAADGRFEAVAPSGGAVYRTFVLYEGDSRPYELAGRRRLKEQ